MNKIIALMLIFQAKDFMLGIAEGDNRAMVESGKWSNVRLAPHLLKQKPNEDAARNYTVSLRQTPVFVTSKRDSEDALAIGGLRNPRSSIQKLGQENVHDVGRLPGESSRR